MTAKTRAEKKRERKRLREEARNRAEYESTPYGWKRKSHCPTALTKFVAAIVAAGLWVWHRLRGEQPKALPATEPPKTDLKRAA